MYRGYYRRQKGFEGKIYRVSMPERDVRGLVATLLIVMTVFAVCLSAAAFAAGLSLR